VKDFLGKKILVTAGPVWVAIDEVRVITNIFRGNLGFLLAKEGAKRGAKVTLLWAQGGMSLPKKLPQNLKVIPFKYFDELFKLMKKEIKSKKYDIVLHSASVADFKPKKCYFGKISSKKDLILHLEPTIKIVDYIKKWDPKIFLVKFKLEARLKKKELIERAFESMLKSKADLIVANDLKNIKEKKHLAFIIDPQKNIVSCQTKKEIVKKLFLILKKKI